MKSVRLSLPAVSVRIQRTDEADPSVPLPEYQTDHAAGMDLRANLDTANREGGLVIAPDERMLVKTGLRVAIPEGYEMQVRPRSGLALKEGLTLVNSPGTIDSDYRGEIGILVINHGQAPVTVAHGARIAQLVLAPVTHCRWRVADTLEDTTRGWGGFGSTGT